MSKRFILLVMDGCGVGALPDAARYGSSDAHSATLPHVARAVGGLNLPNLQRLGLGNVAEIDGVAPSPSVGAWGKIAESSAGKDSVTGHWEMMGIVTSTPFPTYPNGFPPDFIALLEKQTGREILGNVAASGTEILQKLGAEHVQTGKPIVYTSADSVLQIAAHESVISLDDLYRMCDIARTLSDVQRVIARPFVGDGPEDFRRTAHRRDFPLAPPRENFLQTLRDAGKTAHAIGVVADLFPRELFARAERTQTNADALDAVLRAVRDGAEDFVFANCEDFDMLYGHRNDPSGFARALVSFDAALSVILGARRPDDVLILTADHGNDPTTESTDHSREYVPLLMVGGGSSGALGIRATMADIAATAGKWLNVAWNESGASFLPERHEKNCS